MTQNLIKNYYYFCVDNSFASCDNILFHRLYVTTADWIFERIETQFYGGGREKILVL